jgi:predicted NAD/FAD-binding protein
MKHGFHEDGLSSALDVVQKIEVESALNLAAE